MSLKSSIIIINLVLGYNIKSNISKLSSLQIAKKRLFNRIFLYCFFFLFSISKNLVSIFQKHTLTSFILFIFWKGTNFKILFSITTLIYKLRILSLCIFVTSNYTKYNKYNFLYIFCSYFYHHYFSDLNVNIWPYKTYEMDLNNCICFNSILQILLYILYTTLRNTQ